MLITGNYIYADVTFENFGGNLIVTAREIPRRESASAMIERIKLRTCGCGNRMREGKFECEACLRHEG
jgi:hypothetical protein